jgi:hypothetical protein
VADKWVHPEKITIIDKNNRQILIKLSALDLVSDFIVNNILLVWWMYFLNVYMITDFGLTLLLIQLDGELESLAKGLVIL